MFFRGESLTQTYHLNLFLQELLHETLKLCLALIHFLLSLILWAFQALLSRRGQALSMKLCELLRADSVTYTISEPGFRSRPTKVESALP